MGEYHLKHNERYFILMIYGLKYQVASFHVCRVLNSTVGFYRISYNKFCCKYFVDICLDLYDMIQDAILTCAQKPT